MYRVVSKPPGEAMKIFNALQLMTLFAAGPFLITFSHNADFYAHNVLTWVFIVGYLVGFGAMTALVADNLNK